MSPPAVEPLRIIIVGAGICGLSAASALRGEGHDIIILERSKTNKEIGAAISLGPNAVNILASWGFDLVRSRGIPTAGFEIRDADTGDITFTMVDDWHARFGQPWTTLHRVDLHNELKLMATDPNIADTKPALLRTGVDIVDIDVNNASVTLSDGEVIHGDVLVGADGESSFVRDKVLERASPPMPTGHAMYRVLIPAEAIANDPSLNELYAATPMHRGWNKKNRFFLTYWCRNQQFLNIVGVVPADEPKVVAKGWEGTGNLSELRELFADFANPIPQILSHATSAGLWGMKDLDPLETWVSGRTIILGDAAHPMLPAQAHSGGMAIEDAEALSVALGPLTSSPSGSDHSTIKINSLLKQVQAVRYDRATLVQLRSRVAAGYYNNVPMAAEELKKLGTVTPAEGIAQVFGYKGAKEWAREKEMDLPAFS